MYQETVFDARSLLTAALAQLQEEIADEYRAFDDDEEPGIQITLACNADGSDFAIQTGDNSFSGVAYGFPIWAVAGLYKDSDCASVVDDLLSQLGDLL